MSQEGRYTEFREVTNEDLAVYNATNFPLGVSFETPKEVATQVVNGINYRFKTVQRGIYSSPEEKGTEGLVEIYKSSDGKIEFKVFIPANA